MKVALMYSGGKDSTYALDFAREKGWDIRYLVSVKPTRKDCFLFHFATVEHTTKIAELLGLKQVLLSCNVADPAQEAAIVKNAVEKLQVEDPVDAVMLGGTGLQETQIRSIQEALRPVGIEVFAAHAGLDHDKVMKEMTAKGYEFMITQVASDGALQWLGKTITQKNIHELIADAAKHGFHPGGEGGYFDSFVVAGPVFGKQRVVVEIEKVIEDAYCGHIVFTSIDIKQPSLMPTTTISAFE
jgi:diphthine-ammonia ligase